MAKPFSQACENNKASILSVISQYFQPGITVLEIGSYTTQHVIFFAQQLPELTWLPSDTPENLATVQAGLASEALSNILPPTALDVSQAQWPDQQVDGVFSANTLHIMSEAHVACFFCGVGRILPPEKYLCVYGPFKYGGNYTSDSNARFQEWLQDRDSASGIRDFETVDALATEAGMEAVADHVMPANNQLLVWQKKA
jgi:cyclopropane fatty-acyl-phospholipid synthase-like methyltransferase